MKGYFTFFIVFAASLLIISLAQFNISSKYSNYGKAIWVESYYQSEMNIKEAIFEAAREGAIEGVYSYVGNYIAKCVAMQPEAPSPPNLDCLKIELNKKAVEKIKSLDNQKAENLVFRVSIGPDYDPVFQPSCLSPCPPESPPYINYVVLPSLDPLKFKDFMYNYNSNLFYLGIDNKKEVATFITDLVITENAIMVTMSREGLEDVSFPIPQAKVKI